MTRTPERRARLHNVLGRRQPDLRVVLEEITNAHNAAAVLRTCDAASVLHVDLIQAEPAPLPFNQAITTRADKWLVLHRHPTPQACYESLKAAGESMQKTSIPSPHLCPECNAAMVVKFSNGKPLHSSSRYPECKGTRTESGEVRAAVSYTSLTLPMIYSV